MKFKSKRHDVAMQISDTRDFVDEIDVEQTTPHDLKLKLDKISTYLKLLQDTLMMKNTSNMTLNVFGDKCWHLNGKLHREDGPAIEYANGDKCWYLNGEYIDVKTQEDFERYKKGVGSSETKTLTDRHETKRYYLNGKLHREDGPAIEYVNGYKIWCLNDKSIAVNSQEEFERYKRENKV